MFRQTEMSTGEVQENIGAHRLSNSRSFDADVHRIYMETVQDSIEGPLRRRKGDNVNGYLYNGRSEPSAIYANSSLVASKPPVTVVST